MDPKPEQEVEREAGQEARREAAHAEGEGRRLASGKGFASLAGV